MGASQSGEEVALVPQSPPLCAVDRRFCLSRAVELRLQEKVFSLSGDDFKVCDKDGEVYFRCQGKNLSLRDRKTLLDASGTPVLTMLNVFLSIRDKYKVYAGGDTATELFEFTTAFTLIKAKLSVRLKDAVSGAQHRLVLKGNWREKRAVVFLGEPKANARPLARIFRPLTGKSLFLGKDEYMLEIAPGVDIALIVAMCIALDEHQREK